MRRKVFLITGLFISLLLMLNVGGVYAQSSGIISTQEEGEACFKLARQELAKFGVTIPREILLKMRTADEINVHAKSGGGRAIEVGGFYQPYNPETIWILINQSRDRTISDMAHELAHAWQSTNCPLQDRTLTEGFASWCEYKVLTALGHHRYAQYLAERSDPDYGGGLRLFLAVEKKYGVKGVLDFARKHTKVPKDI